MRLKVKKKSNLYHFSEAGDNHIQHIPEYRKTKHSEGKVNFRIHLNIECQFVKKNIINYFRKKKSITEITYFIR